MARLSMNLVLKFTRPRKLHTSDTDCGSLGSDTTFTFSSVGPILLSEKQYSHEDNLCHVETDTSLGSGLGHILQFAASKFLSWPT